MIYSFDVFDTLITRTTATPIGIFALIQRSLKKDTRFSHYPNYIKENFFHLRRNAEELARVNARSKGFDEVTLADIYDAFAMNGALRGNQIKELIKLEKKFEYENIVGIDENISRIKSLIKAEKRVVLISDMYLNEQDIRRMLLKIDPIFKSIPLYTSSKFKKNKITGKLYEVVRKIENVEFNNWVHVGDNLQADVVVAKRFGIVGNQFMFPKLLDYEKNILFANEDDIQSQFIVGTARNLRMQKGLNHANVFGSSIGGGILFSYVWWIIEESKRKGIKRLYFIARDGFVLKKIADIIIEEYSYSISTFYIYGSRKAWRMPSVSKNNYDVYKLIAWSHVFSIKTIDDLANVLQINVDDLVQFLPDEYKNSLHTISALELFLLANNLNENNEFKEWLVKIHKGKRDIVTAYLKQEVDFSDDNFAFVDLAGGGLTQGCLAEIISDFYHEKIKTFFFKLDRINVMTNSIYYTFIPSFLHLNLIVEMLCRAPHGQTEGYKYENERYVPILMKGEESAIIKHGFYDYLDGLEKFCRSYVRVLRQTNNKFDKIDIVLKYMKYITEMPDENTLDFLASMPNSVTGREKKVLQFAPKLTDKQLRYFYVLRENPREPMEVFYQESSLEYSLLRCSDRDKKKINFYKSNRLILLDRFERIYKKSLKSKNKTAAELIDLFPFDLLGNRVIVYGAGKVGQIVYDRICKISGVKVTYWVDENYLDYKQKGFPVESVSSVDNAQYDQVIIAVKDIYVSQVIRQNLLLCGVSKKKIVGVNLWVEWV